MRKTVALFAAAFTMLVAAVLFGLPARFEAPPDLAPEPELEPVVEAPIPAPVQTSLQIGDRVRLEASLSNDYVLAGSSSELGLLMDLTASPVPGATREPMAIAVVLDRSGSMAGDKIRQARRAAKALVRRLSDDDRLAIITYATDYLVDLPLTPVRGQRSHIQRIIDDIQDGGGTNLSGGLQAGLDALRRAQDARIRRLILLSDGNANHGVIDPTVIAQIAADARLRGVTISTLGVGLDFNEDLMTLIAQSGAGGYYYARNAGAIAAAFEKELSGLTSIVARQVEVGLELLPGVSVKEVFGYRTELRGGRLVIPVGDLAGADRRRIMVRLEVTPSANADRLAVGDIVLGYRWTSSDREGEHRGALLAGVTSHRGLARGSERAAVITAFTTADAARARQEAAERFQAGDRAGAVSRIRAKAAELKRRNRKLKSALIERQIDEIGRALDRFEAVDAYSDEGKDLIKREKLRAHQVFVY